MTILEKISKEVKQSVELSYGTKPHEPLQLGIPPYPKLGDFTISTFSLKEQFGEDPKVIAKKIAGNVSTTGIIKKVKAFGPYINMSLGAELFQAACSDMPYHEKNNKCVMVEYLSPNTNKPLHLGHIRNGVLGMAISNMLEHMGYTVIKANLTNDRGIHICKSMIAWQKFADGSTPETEGLKGDHFVGEYYVRFSKESEQNPGLLGEAHDLLKKWEDGDAKVMDLWKTMNEWVYAGFADTYKKAGFLFDVFMYESDTYKLGKDIIDEGLKRGVFTLSDSGAIVFELPGETFGSSQDGSSKKVTVLRSDGTSVYITQDIGTALQKATDHKLDASIYVVGSEQEYHFKCLFEILHALGYEWSDKCYHLSYGMVELPSGKMKSREGTSVDADDLIDKMEKLAETDIRKRDGATAISDEEIAIRAKKIGLGAIKFYLAKADPKQTIQFNPKESISFDGVTGPYCQYAYARARSVIAKAPKEWGDLSCVDYGLLGSNLYERVLAQKFVLLETKLHKAVGERNPAIIANSVYDLARSFNQWYNKYRIIDESKSDISKARLALVHTTAITVKKTLGLLGIEVLEQM